MKLPLNSGAYQNRSLIAGAQRCINLFPERNPDEMDPEAPFTHYETPGFRSLAKAPQQGRGRGLYRASNGDLYGVVGPNVEYIDPNWKRTVIGQIQNQFTPASFADNGQSNGDAIVLVDNSPNGYQINMTSRQLSLIVDPSGLFTGSTLAAFFDTFFLFNQFVLNGAGQKILTNNFYSSLSEQVAFNALDQASKGTFGDPIQGIVVCQRNFFLVGTMTAEPWFDAGDPIFPFEEVFGQLIPYGTIAPYSICTTDVNAFWLSQNKDGRAIMLMIEGYHADRISTFALEDEWLSYPRLDDAMCYTYQQGGHTFVVIHFPSADVSWGYDLATKQWHQRASIDQNGTLHRERVAFHAFAYNTNVGMDWATGEIYALDPNTFTHGDMPIPRVRGFSHITNELKEVTINAFVVDMQTGTQPGTTDELQKFHSPFSNGFSNGFGPLNGPDTEGPQICTRISKNGGAAWGNWRRKGMVAAGHNRSMLRWRGLGMGRDMQVEVGWSAPFKTGLNQAFFEAVEHGA